MKKTFSRFMMVSLLAFTVQGTAFGQPEHVVRVCQAMMEPSTLDPHMHHNIEIEDITSQICEHLIDRDADGKLVPSLATTWNPINETTWQFKLRKGVRFHNGENFDARAVKYSIERIINPNSASPQKQWYGSISHVEAVDDYTINIFTKNVDVLLPSKLSSVLGNIVPMQYLKEAGDIEFSRNPVGTGPFKFLKWVKGEEIILTANKDYWGGQPKIDKVVFKFIADQEGQIAMLKQDELDIVSNISPRSALELKKSSQTDVVKKPTMQYIAFQMNTTKKGPLQDKRIRLALNYAMDTPKLIRYVYNGNGNPLATITMPEEVGFNPTLKPYPFDLAKAKSLIAEAGYSKGFDIILLTFSDLERLGIAIRNQLAMVNIAVKLNLIPRSEYIKAITEQTIDFDVVLGNPTDPHFDASFQLDLLCGSKSPFSRYQNTEIDSLLSKASVTINTTERVELLKRVQEIVYREVPFVFLFQIVKLYGLGAIAGFRPNADGVLRLKNVMRRF